MNIKPYKQEVIALVIKFLEHNLKETSIAQSLKKKYLCNVPQWLLKKNVLMRKGLVKVVKAFVSLNHQVKQYYINRKQQTSDDQSDQTQQRQPQKRKPATRKNHPSNSIDFSQNNTKNKQKKKPILQKNPTQPPKKSLEQPISTWLKNKFEPPQKLQTIQQKYTKSYIKQINHRNRKKSMTPKQASSEDSEDRPLHSESQQIEDKKKKNKNKEVIKDKKTLIIEKKIKKQLKQPSEQSQNSEEVQSSQDKHRRQKKPNTTSQLKINNNINSTKNSKTGISSYSRIKLDSIGPIKTQLQDNSYSAKLKYGQGTDQWGRLGYEKLKDTRGQSFKKTKGKLKNKAFQGTNIDFNAINSIPLN